MTKANHQTSLKNASMVKLGDIKGLINKIVILSKAGVNGGGEMDGAPVEPKDLFAAIITAARLAELELLETHEKVTALAEQLDELYDLADGVLDGKVTYRKNGGESRPFTHKEGLEFVTEQITVLEMNIGELSQQVAKLVNVDEDITE